MTFIKNNLLSLIILFLFGVLLVMFFRGCFAGPPAADIKGRRDTVVTISVDTTTHSHSQTLPTQTNLQPSVTIVPVSVPQPITQPAADITGLVSQVKELIDQNRILLQEKLTQREYPDTTQMYDSAGFKVGEFRLLEKVKGNQLASRDKSYTVNSRTITKTITKTIREPYKPVNQVYIGGGVMGNQIDLVQAFKAGFLLKNKKDQVFEVNGTINVHGGLGAEVGFYKKISFRKN